MEKLHRISVDAPSMFVLYSQSGNVSVLSHIKTITFMNWSIFKQNQWSLIMIWACSVYNSRIHSIWFIEQQIAIFELGTLVEERGGWRIVETEENHVYKIRYNFWFLLIIWTRDNFLNLVRRWLCRMTDITCKPDEVFRSGIRVSPLRQIPSMRHLFKVIYRKNFHKQSCMHVLQHSGFWFHKIAKFFQGYEIVLYLRPTLYAKG